MTRGWIVAVSLKQQLQSELDLSTTGAGIGNRAKTVRNRPGGAGRCITATSSTTENSGARRSEVGSVKKVEKFSAELQIHVFSRDGGLLLQGQIKSCQTGQDEGIASHIAPDPRSLQNKVTVPFEVIIGVSSVANDRITIGSGNQIGPVRSIAPNNDTRLGVIK